MLRKSYKQPKVTVDNRRPVGARGAAALDVLMRDARHGVRRLVRDWRFTAAAVLILGLGIGANTALFGFINAMLFREQSLADPDRLVEIYQNAANVGGIDASSLPCSHGRRSTRPASPAPCSGSCAP